MRKLVMIAALVLGAPLAAHNGLHEAGDAVDQAAHKVEHAAKDAKQAVGTAVDAAGGAVKSAGEAIQKAGEGLKREVAAQAEPLDVLKESVNSHWHNKIVHFPVALGIFGVIFFIAALRWPSYLWPARALMGSALLFGLAALQTGEMAEEGFRGTSLMETVHAHENAGKAGLILLALMLLLTWFPSFRKWSWVVGLLAVACILAAGAFGGALAAS